MSNNFLDIYTDGACSQNGTQNGGWAVAIYLRGETEIKTLTGNKRNATNNEMELHAFLEALRFIEQEQDRYDRFALYTDSAYISNCFKNKWYRRWRQNGWRNAAKKPVSHRTIWEEVLDIAEPLMQEGRLNIIKVAGHSDIEGNLRADYLATQAKEKLGEKE